MGFKRYYVVAVSMLLPILGGIGGRTLADSAPPHGTARDRAIFLESYKHPQFPTELKMARAAGVPDFWQKYGERVPAIINAANYFAELEKPQYEPTPDEQAAYRLIDDPTDAGAAQAADRFLVAGGDVLKLAHSGANCLRFSTMLKGDEDPIRIAFPELRGCRRSAKVISVESIVLARRGRFADAVANETGVFRCASDATRDVGLIGYLVGCACQQHAFSSLNDIVRISRGDPKVCRAVSELIKSTYRELPLGDGLRSDCALSIAQFQYWHNGGPSAFGDLTGEVDQRAMRRPDLYYAILDMNGVFLVRHELAAISVADLPYWSAYRKLSAQEAWLNRYTGIDDTFARVFMPTPSLTLQGHTRVSAAAAVTRAACAVFLYKSKHHAYPSTLADADPTAVDPFDGKLLGYRREPHGFVVYSVGPTLKYDGGAFDNKKQHEELFRYADT